ncbi:MAG: hypothetical protein AAGA86_01220 [Bacteroidota bacterium]
MRYAQLNPIGDYTNWHNESLCELEEADYSDALGNHLLFQNDKIRVWEIRLNPKERLPFRVFRHNYCWSCSTGGLAISRNINGGVVFYSYEEEDIGHVELQGEFEVFDFQNIGFQKLIVHIMEYL